MRRSRDCGRGSRAISSRPRTSVSSRGSSTRRSSATRRVRKDADNFSATLEIIHAKRAAFSIKRSAIFRNEKACFELTRQLGTIQKRRAQKNPAGPPGPSGVLFDQTQSGTEALNRRRRGGGRKTPAIADLPSRSQRGFFLPQFGRFYSSVGLAWPDRASPVTSPAPLQSPLSSERICSRAAAYDQDVPFKRTIGSARPLPELARWVLQWR